MITIPLPPEAATDTMADPLSTARGLKNGLALSALFWLAVGAAVARWLA